MNAPAFDRDLSLRELLAGIPLDKLAAGLRALLGADFRLATEKGEGVLGSDSLPQGAQRAPLRLELEALGYLEAGVGDDKLRAAADLLELLLKSAARYRMASDLHVEAVHADFEALQQEHAALMASEARYKALSADLETRVREQVGIIETTQRQLYAAEKLASVGQLAAGVAHEINNPIGFIRSNLSSAQAYVQKIAGLTPIAKAGDGPGVAAAWQREDMAFVLEDFAELLQESVDGADRVARIVADLKGFSNVDRAQEEMADINECIRAAANMLHSRIQGHAELALELGVLPRILCLPGHLNQVFLHLMLNGFQSVTNGGLIRVTSEQQGEEICIRVSDNGCGIAQETLARIFDPFFTTRDVGQGTGLGLTVSRDIVQAHGGSIEVESAPGSGTTFTIHLPL